MTQFEQADNQRPEQNLGLRAKLLLAAGSEALAFNNLLKDNSRQVPRASQEQLLLHYSRFFTLFDRARGNITPKFHLMYHAIQQINEYGNPRYFATYVDEAFNGVIASIARSCSRLTWTDSIFQKLGAIQQLNGQRFAGFRH